MDLEVTKQVGSLFVDAEEIGISFLTTSLLSIMYTSTIRLIDSNIVSKMYDIWEQTSTTKVYLCPTICYRNRSNSKSASATHLHIDMQPIQGNAHLSVNYQKLLQDILCRNTTWIKSIKKRRCREKADDKNAFLLVHCDGSKIDNDA